MDKAAGKAPRLPGAVRRKFAPWSDPAAKPLIRFERVTKRFGEVVAIDDLSLEFRARFSRLGPLGCAIAPRLQCRRTRGACCLRARISPASRRIDGR
jgi:hypothetical protein